MCYLLQTSTLVRRRTQVVDPGRTQNTKHKTKQIDFGRGYLELVTGYEATGLAQMLFKPGSLAGDWSLVEV